MTSRREAVGPIKDGLTRSAVEQPPKFFSAGTSSGCEAGDCCDHPHSDDQDIIMSRMQHANIELNDGDGDLDEPPASRTSLHNKSGRRPRVIFPHRRRDHRRGGDRVVVRSGDAHPPPPPAQCQRDDAAFLEKGGVGGGGGGRTTAAEDEVGEDEDDCSPRSVSAAPLSPPRRDGGVGGGGRLEDVNGDVGDADEQDEPWHPSHPIHEVGYYDSGAFRGPDDAAARTPSTTRRSRRRERRPQHDPSCPVMVDCSPLSVGSPRDNIISSASADADDDDDDGVWVPLERHPPQETAGAGGGRKRPSVERSEDGRGSGSTCSTSSSYGSIDRNGNGNGNSNGNGTPLISNVYSHLSMSHENGSGSDAGDESSHNGCNGELTPPPTPDERALLLPTANGVAHPVKSGDDVMDGDAGTTCSSVTTGTGTTTVHVQALLLGLAFAAVWSPQNLMAPNLTQMADFFHFSANQRDLFLGANIAIATGVLSLPVSGLIGFLADMVRSRRNLYAVTVALGGLATLWSGMSPTYANLYFARFVCGGCMAGSVPVAFSLLGDLFAPAERNAASSGLTACMGGGMIIGQVYAGVVGDEHGWQFPFYVCGSVTIALALAVVRFVKEPVKGGKEVVLQDMIKRGQRYDRKLTWSGFRSAMRENPSNAILMWQGFFTSVPWGIIMVFLNDYLSQECELSVPDATFLVLLFGLGAAAGGIIGGWAGQVTTSIHPSYMPIFMAVSTFLGILPFVGLLNSTFPNGATALPCFYALSGGFIANLPSVNVRPALINVNPPETRGAALTAANLVINLARGTGPMMLTSLGAALDINRQMSFNILLISFWTVTAVLLLMLARTLPIDQDRMEKELERYVARNSNEAIDGVVSVAEEGADAGGPTPAPPSSESSSLPLQLRHQPVAVAVGGGPAARYQHQARADSHRSVDSGGGWSYGATTTNHRRSDSALTSMDDDDRTVTSVVSIEDRMATSGFDGDAARESIWFFEEVIREIGGELHRKKQLHRDQHLQGQVQGQNYKRHSAPVRPWPISPLHSSRSQQQHEEAGEDDHRGPPHTAISPRGGGATSNAANIFREGSHRLSKVDEGSSTCGSLISQQGADGTGDEEEGDASTRGGGHECDLGRDIDL